MVISPVSPSKLATPILPGPEVAAACNALGGAVMERALKFACGDAIDTLPESCNGLVDRVLFWKRKKLGRVLFE